MDQFERKAAVELDEKLRKQATRYADNISANSGEAWVQIWEDAYESKVEELRRLHNI